MFHFSRTQPPFQAPLSNGRKCSHGQLYLLSIISGITFLPSLPFPLGWHVATDICTCWNTLWYIPLRPLPLCAQHLFGPLPSLGLSSLWDRISFRTIHLPQDIEDSGGYPGSSASRTALPQSDLHSCPTCTLRQERCEGDWGLDCPL